MKRMENMFFRPTQWRVLPKAKIVVINGDFESGASYVGDTVKLSCGDVVVNGYVKGAALGEHATSHDATVVLVYEKCMDEVLKDGLVLMS